MVKNEKYNPTIILLNKKIVKMISFLYLYRRNWKFTKSQNEKSYLMFRLWRKLISKTFTFQEKTVKRR